MRFAVIAVALFGILLASAATATVADAVAAEAEPQAYEQQMARVAPGVWAFIQPGFHVQPAGNVTLIEQADGYVMIDTGGSPGAARRIVAAICKLGPKPVKAVAITHWHGDHPLGLSEILKAWPEARTIATTATQAHLKNPATMNTPAVLDPEANAKLLAQYDGFVDYALKQADAASDARIRDGWMGAADTLRRYRADIDGAVTLSTAEAFDDRLVLDDPERPVELRFLGRANTDGDAVAWLPRQRIVVTGDIVVAPVPFGFGGYPREWQQALAQLKALQFRLLVPGHGPVQRDSQYIDRLDMAIARARAAASGVVATGGDVDAVQKAVARTQPATAFTGGDAWLGKWYGDYWGMPFAKSAYLEAKDNPITQSMR